MSAAAVTGWTSHGHRIDGVASTSARPPVGVARCGGPAMCGTCAKEAYAQQYAQREAVRLGGAPLLGLATTRELLEEIVARFGRLGDRGGPGAGTTASEPRHPGVVTTGHAAEVALRSLPPDVLEYRTVDRA